MWLAKKLNRKKLKTFVFPGLPILFGAILLYAGGAIHLTLALYLVLLTLLIGWLPTKIGWLPAKALFPSLPSRCDFRSWRWGLVVWLGLWLILMIPFKILFYHVGVPEWALWRGDFDPPRWRHGFFIAVPIAALTAQFVTVLSFAWRLQKKNRQKGA